MPRKFAKTALLALVASTALSAPSLAQEAGDIMVRFRGLAIAPDESATTSIGGTANVSTAYVPEVDITYFLTKNLALELIAATANHDAQAIGTVVGDVDLGDTWILPPTLSLQYHFNASEGLKPYLGAGVNYTFFYGGKEEQVDSLDFSNSAGFSLQGGFDIDINEKWVFNIDVKRLFLATNVEIEALGTQIIADVNIDPWIIGVGFGYKFW